MCRSMSGTDSRWSPKAYCRVEGHPSGRWCGRLAGPDPRPTPHGGPQLARETCDETLEVVPAPSVGLLTVEKRVTSCKRTRKRATSRARPLCFTRSRRQGAPERKEGWHEGALGMPLDPPLHCLPLA